MTLSLTQAEAQQKLSQVQDARNQAVAILSQIADTQQSMLSSSWKGGSATTYGGTSSQQQEDAQQIINYLNQIVETGSAQINAVANMDNG
ncbi:hypothetical protein A5714_24390 [Mycobacterium sp. E2462]|uniref:hypothetical protein n=1 Tax=unclassified Mycobacterium TaxID=2642494 RepID=UPI0007FD30C9|nr:MULTISPECIES: hypothetical protein [unclassified Mycobacterium]OBG76871.1 hypothetical protein A5700_21065 [Mycobacterium sp. E1214]OBH24009.1 hypothetical protein A5693_08785 [Mycobacterium sp. E1319]OBI05536.1 hypothetical protein A5714_24390 [Mycobacterium sp. E2462]